MIRRGFQRRLEAVLARLVPTASDATPPATAGGLEGVVRGLEAASREIAQRQGAADLLASQLAGALDHIEQGIVISDGTGVVVYRNAQAGVLERARGGDVLADQAVAEALREARAGRQPEQTLELFSPLRRTLVIRAYPLFLPPAGGGVGDEAPPALRLLAGIAGPGGSAGDAAPAADGTTELVADAPVPLTLHPSPAVDLVGAVAVVEDVSQRRRLENVRRDFVANVSHELKTPVGALSLLAETLDGEDDPDVVTRLSARVAAEAGRLGRIIDELLDLSRIEVNDAPGRDVVPVQRLVAEASQPLRHVAHTLSVELVVAPVPAELAVPGDRRDLVSAVSNLVDNALKYSEDHGRVSVDVTAADGWAEIAVTDNGIGIPSRDLERIFERFYRVDRARSRSTGGTGLGLSIVRHIAVNHGGTVGVRSVEGEGSTFSLRLPTHDQRRLGDAEPEVAGG